MSFDYFVVIRKGSWPTALAVQNAISSLRFPLALVQPQAGPFSVADYTLPVVLEGRQTALEASIERAADAGDPESLFGYIAECVASEFPISNEDYFLTLTFRSDVDEIRAGLYLAAAMILKFGGYGFENQFESHGGSAFAEQLIAEAANLRSDVPPKGLVQRLGALLGLKGRNLRSPP